MTAISSVVLVDKRIHDHETIVSAVKADGVRCIVFDVFDVDTYCQEQASTAFQYILNKIAELGIAGSVSNIGIVQHNTGAPFHRFFAKTQGEESTIMGVETTDPTLQTWAGFTSFVTTLKNTYGVQNVDLMACALYSNPDWKYVIDTLAIQTGVTIRASTDDTGAASLGGDWFLESHTGVNLKDVYFTEAIENFSGVLYMESNYWDIVGSYRRPVKSFAVGRVELWGWTNHGGSNNTSVDLSNTIGLISNEVSMAALKTNGSVVVWGVSTQGASYSVLSDNVSVPTDISSGVVDVVGNSLAFAAIKTNGSVVIWGRIGYGGNNNTGVNLTNVVDIYPTGFGSFAALKSDGSVVGWGYTSFGGSTTSPVNAASSLTSGVVLIYSNGASYAALKTNGSVVTWGASTYGGDSSSQSGYLTSDVVAVYSMNSAYAALKNNGILVIWGNASYGGTVPGGVNTDVIHVFPTAYSAVALKTDSSIVHWGNSSYTGTAPNLTNVVTLCANVYAFAALKSDGTVVVWGNNTSYGSSASTPVNSASLLTSGPSVIALYSNYWAFAALKSDGTVVCWGNAIYGGTVPAGLTGVVTIRAAYDSFAALKNDGSVVVWGNSSFGGSNNTSASISSGIVDVYNNKYSFAALKTTSTPSYDLSMSYYNELDRLSILCSRDYRRTANLTANSNKFTVSLTRSLQKFNYTMPTNQPLTLVVPDYQSGSYTLTSTITLPATAGGANSKSFLITSEVGERIDISGVGTYVNYGTYVYKMETNGTYTKTTSLTVNNTTFKLYGGDGFYYSGIALYYRFGAFTVPAKTTADASFNLTAPVSDSSGAFTYTSSNTSVATVTSGGTVTIVGSGTSTITATQAASGTYPSDSVTASLVVSFPPPTIGTLTVPAKNLGDASFNLTAPTSNSGGAFTYTSSNTAVATVTSGGTVTIVGAGTTTITATQAASGNYTTGSVTASFVVSLPPPTIGTLTAPSKNFGDAAFNLTAPTSNSNGAFSYTSSDTAVATVTSGGMVTVVGAGTTTITATQAATTNYTSGSVTASLVVSAIAPTIGTLTAPAKNFGDAAFNLTAPTSNSDGAFSYTSSNTAVATVTSGGTVTIVGVGSTTITATQAATTNYTSSSVTASLVVSASLSNFNVPAKTYGDASFNLTDPETTDNTVGFTFASSNTAVATLSGDGGRTVTIVGAGSTVITATQAATANRGQLDISATLVVSPATPVITIAPITKAYGNASFRPVPTTTNTDTSGGLAFTFTSNNIAVVSMLDASLVRINGVGTATLSITQAASANFTDASSSVIVTVNKGVSGFSASTFTVAANKTFGDAAFAITTAPISSSTGAITYTSSDESVAVITSNGSGNAITVVGQGTVTFTASQAESALYAADTNTSNTLTVARKTAALTRDSPSTDTISKAYGNAAFTVTAANESNGAFSFTSSDPSIATIDASTGEVTIIAIGSTTLTANRAQTAQYNASSVSWTLNIVRGTTTLTGLTSLTRNVTVAPFTATATSTSNGAVSYALQDQSSTVLTIHPTSGLVTLLSPGSAVIVALQAQGTLYEAPTSITATITVTAAGNTLQGATLTNTQSFANVDLSGASLSNANIANTNFSSGRLENSNFNSATISGANMTSAGLTGATMRGSIITGTDFTSAILRRTDLSGANVRSSIFNNADLSGSTLVRLDASGASFINANLRGANLSNADFTNANMTNADIDGADITNVTFTTPQKLQLLKNQGNRARSEIQVSQLLGSVLLPVLSAGSAVRDVPNVANATFKVVLPTTSLVANETIPDITLDISNFAYFYFPIGENEYFQIQGVKYYISGSTVRNYATGAAVENTTYGIKAIRLLAGSLTIIVNSQNTLSTSSFVVPSMKQNTDAPFSPTTLPTSNSSAPIVYSSSNTNIATINSSTGVITPVAGASGFVRFTASQAATETHESASIMSNELFVNQQIDLTLVGLNQTFSLSTLASLDASSIAVETTDATAVFYVRLSDMTNLFQYQTDAFDVNNVDASDIKYYVFHRTMPTELHINPSHAMMNKTESAGMLGIGIQEISADKSLVKHDFVRYIALRLFNTHYGVDLFQNEQELHENITYLGETIQHNIDTILSGISTTSASQDMAYDASGNKYLTNDSSGNTNLCRELMRQLAAAEPSRFYNNGADTATYGIRTMPLREDDSINFKLTITAAEGQNIVTGVTVIPSRTYLIKMILKNTVNASTNANTVVTDSEMYPNSYPYSTSVVTYAPTGESSSGVYNVYSPPAPIPTARFGYNGWYYANSTTWVNVAQAVRDRVKWVLPPNAAGSSTVADLRYVRMNLKVFNKTSLPFLVVTTQAGSSRKYTISAAPNSLTNGTVYSFYMNFNSYTREPATVGTTNAALTYSNVGSGSFANGEVIISIAVETDSEAASGTVEFTLSSVVIGEASGEKEYGFSANV